MSATNDVAQAIEAAWAAGNLDGVVPGGLRTLPLPATRPTVPYATLYVRKDGRPNQPQSDGQYIDYRRVKIVLFGVGQTALGALVSQVLGALWKVGKQWVALNIPNAQWLRTEYVSDDIELEEPVAGEDVRSAPMEFVIWSQRQAA